VSERKRSIAVQVAAAFNSPAKLRELVGEEAAARIEREQREVASKVHRSPPPSLDGMRFR
jgi:hypothetical protein